MIYCFDIDGTICTPTAKGQYEKAKPYPDIVKRINALYDSGNIIKFMTGRGCVSGVDYTELTEKQLKEWGLKYHELIMNKKPHADLFIDDRGINVEDWMKGYGDFFGNNRLRGIVAGSFDIMHRGYIEMFREAKMNCSHLTVALHDDPTTERPNKLKPVQSLEDRKVILESIGYIDQVITYKEEKEFEALLNSGEFDVRFLGKDYFNGGYSGVDADIKIIWINRNHNLSTTKLKEEITKSVQNKRYQ